MDRKMKRRLAMILGLSIPEDDVLPPGWIRCSYIRSSGTQYIDIGYKGKEDSRVRVRYRYHEVTSATGSGRVFGSRSTSTSNAFALGSSSGVVTVTNNKVFWCYDNQAYYVVDSPVFAIDEWIDVVLSATVHTVNGVTHGDDYNVVSFTTPNDLILFGFDNNGSIGVGYVDVAECQYWEGNALLRDFIPVYDGAEYALYDRVSGIIFHNDGTGDFAGDV